MLGELEGSMLVSRWDQLFRLILCVRCRSMLTESTLVDGQFHILTATHVHRSDLLWKIGLKSYHMAGIDTKAMLRDKSQTSPYLFRLKAHAH